jgi:hypothetical protein
MFLLDYLITMIYNNHRIYWIIQRDYKYTQHELPEKAQ